MKIQATLITTFFLTAFLIAGKTGLTQDYKLKQSTTVSGMKSETTIYVKGKRKRTEGGGFMGMGANMVSIEQCDLQRTIRINDKKKLYYIEPFSSDNNEIVEEDEKPVAKTKAVPAASTQKGGTIYMWQTITDTGERKKMYGVVARHVWTSQKIKPSADACMMKDSMIIKTDGWYIDLPQFNCPVNSYSRPTTYNKTNQPECRDKYVSKKTGKGRLGFPLTETRTMIMGNGQVQTTEYTTSLETLELSMAKLDSMLFEIPIGYKETKNAEDLEEKFDMGLYMSQSSAANETKQITTVNPADPKKAGSRRVGIMPPGGDDQLQKTDLQQQLVNSISADRIEAIAVESEEQARKYNCDLLLNSEISKIKPGSKVGGFIKALKNSDPNALSSYSVEGSLSLKNLSSKASITELPLSGKYDGKPTEAALKAMEKGWEELRRKMSND